MGEQALRDALRQLVNALETSMDDPDAWFSTAVLDAFELAQDRLAEAGDEPEMVRLLRWLEEFKATPSVDIEAEWALMEVILHIESLGYKLEDYDDKH